MIWYIKFIPIPFILNETARILLWVSVWWNWSRIKPQLNQYLYLQKNMSQTSYSWLYLCRSRYFGSISFHQIHPFWPNPTCFLLKQEIVNRASFWDRVALCDFNALWFGVVRVCTSNEISGMIQTICFTNFHKQKTSMVRTDYLEINDLKVYLISLVSFDYKPY